MTNYTKQGYCRGCGAKTTHLCSECVKIRRDHPELNMKEPFFCRSHKTGKYCFELHKNEEHATE